MTKLYAEVLKLRNNAVQGSKIASNAGQHDAVEKWNTRLLAYETVLGLLGDPEITPTRWKKLICRIFHQRNSLKCPNCGGRI
jgi:hypothetical protein